MSIADRTIIVATRLSERELHVTYCNALTARRPVVLTVVWIGPPWLAVGLPDDRVPDVGRTVHLLSDD